MHPWAQALVIEREKNDHKDDLLNRCMPPGVPRIDMTTSAMPHPFKIVQTPSLVVLLYETSVNSTFRQVFLDGRKLPKDPDPTWLGYSVGHWEGDTLVVETTGFNGLTWIDTREGHPLTEQGHVTERFARRDFGHLEIGIAIDDPKAYLKPWSAKVPAYLLPDSDLIETYCENEKDSSHMDETRLPTNPPAHPHARQPPATGRPDRNRLPEPKQSARRNVYRQSPSPSWSDRRNPHRSAGTGRADRPASNRNRRR